MAATYWYHPHLHPKTQAQLACGAGGLIIIRAPQESALELPRTYGADHLPLVLTSRRFKDDSQFDLTAVYRGSRLTNGVLHGEATLPAQFVRLRLVNAETERPYNLGFKDGRRFYVIATDGGLVDAPNEVTRLKLYVGERVKILVDLSKETPASAVDLQSFNGGLPLGFPGGEPATGGGFGSLLTFEVLHVKLGAKPANSIDQIPTALVKNSFWIDANVTNSRTVKITDNGPGPPFTFDGAGFDEAIINPIVALCAVERWTITNDRVFDHPLHIHDVQFKILSRSDGPVARFEQGWKNTLSLPLGASVSFIAKFDGYASPTDPFMYHCLMAITTMAASWGSFS